MDCYMELMAYFASLIVLISFIIKDVILLRVFNTIGCVLFLIYSIYYDKTPLIFLNFMIIVVNIIYVYKPIITLWKERLKRK